MKRGLPQTHCRFMGLAGRNRSEAEMANGNPPLLDSIGGTRTFGRI